MTAKTWVCGVVFGFGVVLGAAGCGSPEEESVPVGVKTGGQNVPASGRYIVKFRSTPFGGAVSAGFLAQPARTMLSQVAGSSSDVSQLINNTYVLNPVDAADLKGAAEQLRAMGEVEYVEEDPIAYAVYSPSDPGISQQWAHDVVRSREAWDIGRGSRSVTVAVIDTGVDYTHPDLAANIWTNPQDGSHGVNFVNGTNDPMADDYPHYHGTHVAGSIGALDNGAGVVGSSPSVTIMPLKFLAAGGSGNVSDAVRAIYYAVQHGAKILSNSWGSTQPSQALLEAMTAARDAGVLFVVAAGNGDQAGNGLNNDVSGTYPANYGLENVITVAATDRSDRLTRFSNYGAQRVHVAAPGQDIYSTMNGSGYQTMSGTSMATPLVSGVAATIMALRPDLDYRAVKRAILDNVDALPALQGRVATGGRINAYRAIASVRNGGPGPEPTPTPTPTPPPSSGVARTPLLAGMPQLMVNNPYAQIPLDYDVSEYPGTVGVYIEISRPGQQFRTGGVQPDPGRLSYARSLGTRGRLVVVPVRDLPGWGVYQMRVIPLGPGDQPMAGFSAPATLVLRP